jgi:16S rRNA processing protein RimM
VELIDVGYARRAHGIGGEVVVRPLSDDPDRWVKGATFVTDDEQPRTLEVVAVRLHHDDLLVRFAGVDDRGGAEALRGVTFRIPASARRALGDHEFWPDQLIGCAVVGGDGETLGAVVDVAFGVGQDRLIVEATDGGRVAVPFVEAIVPEVDLEARLIRLTPPDGLFD